MSERFSYENRQIHPVVTLQNGLRVANFSSPHSFTFDDGTVLPACPLTTVEGGKLDTEEEESITVLCRSGLPDVEITNVELSFKLSDTCKIMLNFLSMRDDIDIILVPFPVLICLKNTMQDWNEDIDVRQVIALILRKCRVVRVKDRVSKVIHSDRFCV